MNDDRWMVETQMKIKVDAGAWLISTRMVDCSASECTNHDGVDSCLFKEMAISSTGVCRYYDPFDKGNKQNLTSDEYDFEETLYPGM